MSIADLIKIWDKFWFAESSPLPVAVYRLLFGLIAVLNFVFLLPELYLWFGSGGIVSRQAVINWTGTPGMTVFNFMPDNDKFLIWCFVLFLLAAGALCIGLKSRLACVLLFIGLNSIYHRDPFILNSGDSYMRVSLFWLIFAASGSALSFDRWFDRWKTKAKNDHLPGPDFENYKAVSIWPLRLLQLQLALVYCHTFVKKFWGASWFDGNAVYFSSRVEDLRRFPIPYIFDHMWTVQFLTWSTLGLEFALFTLIWVKETRYYVLACGAIFHLTIDYHMNIPFFEYLMIVSYVLFIEPRDLAWVLRLIKKRLPITSQA